MVTVGTTGSFGEVLDEPGISKPMIYKNIVRKDLYEIFKI